VHVSRTSTYCRATASKGLTSERVGVGRQTDAGGANSSAEPPPRTLKAEVRQDRVEVCDKIIAVFRAKPSSEWRKLIAFSKQWKILSDSLFQRLQHRVDTETDQKERAGLKKLNRKLKEVHGELQRHNEVLARFMSTPESSWEALVTSGRGSLSTDFFAHMENLVRASHDDNAKRDEIARVATRLLVLVDALDKTVANEDAMAAAGLEFQNLLEQVTSMEDADRRIDDLAKSGKLDPALMLTMAKAYSSAKDTDYTKEQVRDVMAHLYFKAKESFAAQQPPAVRILKHLLWIDSPADRRKAMDEAFTPGAELATSTQDFLTTTPAEMQQIMEAILAAYDSNVSRSQASSGMQQDANGLMNPKVIEQMRVLLGELRKNYL